MSLSRPRLARSATALALVLVAALSFVGACADSPTAPKPDVSPASLTPVAQTNNQTAVAGSAVANAPAVTVKNAAGDALAGIAVTFAITSGAGSATGTTAATNAQGVATVGSWTLGTTAGANSMSATVAGLAAATFSATGSAGAPVSVTIAAGDNQSATVGTAVATAVAAKVADANGNGVQGVSVAFAVTGGGGAIAGSPAITNASGVATAGSWTLGTATGANTLTATATGIAVPASFGATGTAGAPATVTVEAGNGQSAVAGTATATAPAVKVVDANGNVALGASVVFTVTGGGGSVTGSPATTGANGIATVGSWILGATVGANTLNATVAGVAAPVSFAATGTPGAPATVTKQAGDGQSATTGTPVTTAPQVKVVDANGNAVPDVGVTFAVTAGNGSVTGSPVATDADGIATVGSWTMGDSGNNTLSATVVGVAPVVFSATSVGIPSMFAIAAGNNQIVAAGTRLPVDPAVEVRDAGGNTLQGVIVIFTAFEGSVTSDTVLTDAAGIAAVGWTLDTIAGPQFMRADIAGFIIDFDATGIPGPVARIVVGGDNQTGTVGQITFPISIDLFDQFTNAVSGVTPVITPSGNGSINVLSVIQATTNLQWTLGTTPGPQTLTVRTTVGGPVIGVVNATAIADVPSVLVVTAGAGQTAPQGVAVSIAPAVRVEDQYGNILPGVAVDFGASLGGSVTGSPVTSGADGVATVGSWTLGTVGTNLLGVSAGTAYIAIEATATLVVGSIEISSGDGQIGTVGSDLPAPVVVQVRDILGNIANGVPVTFTVTAGGGSVPLPSATTQGAGTASSSWQLGGVAGTNTNTLTVSVDSDPSNLFVTFGASGLASWPASLSIVAGGDQTATAGTAVAIAPSVRVEDQYGNPVSGVDVTFSPSGNGQVIGSPVTTGSDGIATLGSWTLSTTPGGNTLTVTVPTVNGGFATLLIVATGS